MSTTTSKSTSRYRIPTVADATPTVSLSSSSESTDSSASLDVFLAELGDPMIEARIGVEKEVAWSMAVDDRLEAGRYFVQQTLGEKFKAPAGGWRMGGRWLLRDMKSDEPVCAALNFTVDQPSPGQGKKSVIISNLVARQNRRGEGLASFLVSSFLGEYPKALLDTSMTADGARFFGFNPDNPAERQASDHVRSNRGSAPKA